MRPSDIVRGELQLRRRLLAYLNEGGEPGMPVPLADLPADDANISSLPPARAAAALTQPRQASGAAAVVAAADSTEAQRDIAVGPEVVAALQREPWYKGQIAHVSKSAPRSRTMGSPRVPLEERLRDALREYLGLPQGECGAEELPLYVHQAKAVDASVGEGRDVIVSTSTGSGKSLVYIVAMFEALLRSASATALLIFPTKALAQDQLRALHRVVEILASKGVRLDQDSCACLDGDTPHPERARIRKKARVLLTNPDMLHSHILPKCVEYAAFVGSLKYVVLDEVHVYRGAFGAHVANILRRLRRMACSASCLGAEEPSSSAASQRAEALQFLGCSATVANPGEHFQKLIGPRTATPVVVTEDGSPGGAHVIVLWNPGQRTGGSDVPASQSQPEAGGSPARKRRRQGRKPSPPAPEVGPASESKSEDEGPQVGSDDARKSPIVEVARLVAWLVSHNMSVLAFCKWRSLVEIILQDVRDALVQSGAPQLAEKVISYRAGYPAALRRSLERRIFSRDALGVTCTNALELGVDIGRLDCTISLGFPGSTASLRQQFGRAGRAGRPGVSFFVAFGDATDQHFVRRPRQLLARRPEAVALAPANAAVMRAHLPCAAAERPLARDEGVLWCPGARDGSGSAAGLLETRLPAGACSPSRWDEVVRLCIADGWLEERPGDEAVHGPVFALPALQKGFGGPHKRVSIRAVEERFEVVVEPSQEARPMDMNAAGGFLAPGGGGRADIADVAIIDEIERSKAFYSLYPGSVYKHRGAEYLIVDLNLRRRRATARKFLQPPPYYTRAFDATKMIIHTREQSAHAGGARVCFGQVERESRVKSYRRFWKSVDMPQEAEIELDLPSWGYSSHGLWFEPAPVQSARLGPGLGNTSASSVEAQALSWAGAHAAMHALLHVFPLFVLAERADIDAACVDEHGIPVMDRQRLLIFDAKEGGLGLCEEAFPNAFAMLREARRLVQGCPCEDGCPCCIFDAHCWDYNRLLSKRGALLWFQVLLEGFSDIEGEDGGNATEGEGI